MDDARRVEPARYARLSQAAALQEAADMLSCTSPRYAWSLCALLSVVEALPKTEAERLFFPTLNLEKVRLLCEAALESRTRDDETQILTADQIVEALNLANKALDDRGGVQQMQELGAIAGEDLALSVFLARLGNIQIRHQDPRFHERAGRLIAMYEALPKTHRAKMTSEFWDLADPVLDKVRNFLEFPILSLAAAIWALLMLYEAPFRQVIEEFNVFAATARNQEGLFKELLRVRHRYMNRMVLPIERRAERTVIDRFIELFGRRAHELRDLRQRDITYSRGEVGRRLSPLERFPVVVLSKDELVVPNIRYLYRGFADVIHFSLQEARIEGHDAVRGGLQELYLHALVEAQLPRVEVIRERVYRRSGADVKGPDLTLVEGDRLITVESKAQRIQAETRLGMVPENLLANLDGAVEAIRRSAKKIEELYTGLPEYADVQAVIDRTRGKPPIAVAVVGEEISMMGEVLSGLVGAGLVPKLENIDGLHCILGLDAFERAVEVAAGGGRPLGDLLEEYVQTAGLRHDTLPVDEFGGHVELVDTFAASFIRDSVASAQT